jgi:hypothetical protein
MSAVLLSEAGQPIVHTVASSRADALRWFHHYAAWSIAKRMPNGRFATPLTLVFSRADVQVAAQHLPADGLRRRPSTILRGWLGMLHMDDARLASATLYGYERVLETPAHFGRPTTVAASEPGGHAHAAGSKCQSCEMRELLLQQEGIRLFVDKFKTEDTRSEAICALCPPILSDIACDPAVPSAAAFTGDVVPDGISNVRKECFSVLMLKLVLQHVAYGTPATPRVLIPFHEITVRMKDGTTHGNLSVQSKPSILALNGHEYSPLEAEEEGVLLHEDATGVSLAPDGNCVIRVAIDLSTGSGEDVRMEPECLEAIAGVSIVIRDARCPHSKVGTLVLPMDTPATEAGVWRAYRAVPGGRYTRIERDEESPNLGCVLLCGPL